MTRARLGAAAFVALALVLPTAARAGPWTPAPGGGYAKLQARWLPGFGWNPGPAVGGGRPVAYASYHEIFLGGFYAELGLAPRVALVAQGDGLRIFALADPVLGGARPHVNLGEPTVALKLQPVQAGRFALGVQGFLRPPVGGNEVVQEVRSIEDGNAVVGGLRVATGVVEGGALVEAGLGFARLYVAASVGPRFRGGGWDTVLQWSAEAGTSVGRLKRTALRVRVAGFHPLRDGSAPYHASPSGIGNGTAYVGFTVELERRLTELLSAGFAVAGGLGPVVRQTGGPVITAHVAVAWP